MYDMVCSHGRHNNEEEQHISSNSKGKTHKSQFIYRGSSISSSWLYTFQPYNPKSPLHKINSELIKPFSRFVGKVAIVVQFIYKYLSTHTGAHAPRHVCAHKQS